MVNDKKKQNSILTEAEITALAASFDTPSYSDDGEFRRYDFNTRQALLLANWNVLRALMADQGAALKTIFKRDFRTELSVVCHPPVCISAHDFVIELPERALLVSTEIDPFAGQSYLSIDADLIDRIMSQSSGGTETQGARLKGALISSERRIGQRVASQFFGVMEEIWTRHLRLSIGNLDAHMTTTPLTIAPSDSGFVKFSYAFSAGGRAQSEITLLLPFDGLRLNAEQLMTRQADQVKQHQQSNRYGELYRVLPDIPIEVAGVLMSREISIGDLMATQVGAVIPINDQMEVSLYVGDSCFAKGHYEVELGKQACRIIKFKGRS